MSKDKYPSIFSCQMEVIAFNILQTIIATCTVLKTGEYPRIFPSFSWGIYSYLMCLNKSHASKNI